MSEMSGCLFRLQAAQSLAVFAAEGLYGRHIFTDGRPHATLRLDRLHEEGGKLPRRELLFDHFDVGRRDA